MDGLMAYPIRPRRTEDEAHGSAKEGPGLLQRQLYK
jgi:hypothetical protein